MTLCMTFASHLTASIHPFTACMQQQKTYLSEPRFKMPKIMFMVGVRNDASPERFVSLCLSNITNPNQIKATLLI